MSHTVTHYRIRQLLPNDLRLHAVCIMEDGEPDVFEADYLAVVDITEDELQGSRVVGSRDIGTDVCLVEYLDGEFDVCNHMSNYAGPCRPGEDAMKVDLHLDADQRERRDAWAERTGTRELIVTATTTPQGASIF